MTGDTVLRIPTLETERLRLRAPEARDFDAYAAFCASERAEGVGGPYPRGEASTRFSALCGHWVLRGFGRWVVADRETDEALGVCGLNHPEAWPEPEVAWTVFEKAEGRSIAFEAAVAARRHAYEELGWTTAISVIHPDNARSVALAQRMGCRRESDFKHEDSETLMIWRHPAPSDLARETAQ